MHLAVQSLRAEQCQSQAEATRTYPMLSLREQRAQARSASMAGERARLAAVRWTRRTGHLSPPEWSSRNCANVGLRPV